MSKSTILTFSYGKSDEYFWGDFDDFQNLVNMDIWKHQQCEWFNQYQWEFQIDSWRQYTI